MRAPVAAFVSTIVATLSTAAFGFQLGRTSFRPSGGLSRIVLRAVDKEYNVLTRVRELEILQRTVDSGILSKLDNLGVTLEDLEAALPIADRLGIPALAAATPPFLLGGVVYLVVESAPIVLPVAGLVLGLGPAFFFVTGAGAIGAEGALAYSGLVLPVIDVPAWNIAGFFLVPLSAVLLGAGLFLGSFKKD